MPPELQTIVDEICVLGCTHVNKIITLLEQGKTIDTYHTLSRSDYRLVLQELKCIMRVYVDRD